MTTKNKLLIDVITLFPEFFRDPLNYGPMRRARELEVFEVRLWNPRDFVENPKDVDDYPYGGGSGMVLKFEPIKAILDKVKGPDALSVYLTPQGVTFNEELARDLSRERHIILLCGRYKGVDERIVEEFDLELSIGDYVLSGGEPAALVVLDSVVRHIPGALGEKDSADTDSFATGILDASYYTRPREVDGKKVPEVLLSGHHKAIERWRRKEALKRTLLKRPDLLLKAPLSDEDMLILEEIKFEILHTIEKLKAKKENKFHGKEAN